ncbi:protein LTO1 homolog isoform X2 [Sminthopsis crassicaudata]|uniref:protein LTO1 homolog isoform X2 n=1 Tax=Sminthopsis crassicaudata TaxID=9301 RepID=UPI003D6871A6
MDRPPDLFDAIVMAEERWIPRRRLPGGLRRGPLCGPGRGPAGRSGPGGQRRVRDRELPRLRPDVEAPALGEHLGQGQEEGQDAGRAPRDGAEVPVRRPLSRPAARRPGQDSGEV